MERYTEEMKLWLFDLAHGNLSDADILKGFIKHYVLYEFSVGNVQQDIFYHTNYGHEGIVIAMENLKRVLVGMVYEKNEMEKVWKWGEKRREVLEEEAKNKPSIEHKAAKSLKEGWTWEKATWENRNDQGRGILSSPEGISYYAYEKSGSRDPKGSEYWIGGTEQPIRHYFGEISDEEAEKQVLQILNKEQETERPSAVKRCMDRTAKRTMRQEPGKER